MNTNTYVRASLIVGREDVEDAGIKILETDGCRWPSISLGALSIMPVGDEDLANVLRRLADRVEAAMVADARPLPDDVEAVAS